MTHLTVTPAKSLVGKLSVPGDKSISHRALLIGALSSGKIRIRKILRSQDVESTADALRNLGISLEDEGEDVILESPGSQGLQAPPHILDMGNSGTTTRLLLGILAGQSFSATLTGDASLSQRPMGRVVEPLQKMGARISGPGGIDRLPLTIQGGKLKGRQHSLTVPSAQVKSALLLAGLSAQGSTSVAEVLPTRDHTERLLKSFGADVQTRGLEVTIHPGGKLISHDLEIPGDISSAAFFLTAAALVPGSQVTVQEVGLNPSRTGFLEILKKMGAGVKIVRQKTDWEPLGEVTVDYQGLKGISILELEIPGIIDELPILMVAATQAQGKTVIEGAGELKVKETDRIHSMVTGLSAMGARIQAQGETVVIEGPTPLKGTRVSSFEDHRTAMSLAMAALVAQGKTDIAQAQWIDISFPSFWQLLKTIRR